MRRIVVTAITILVCFLLQTSVFDLFKLADTVPNVLLILVASVSVMRGQKEGMLTGFFSGLLLDIFYGSWLGGFAFLYMFFGFVDGLFNQIYYSDDNFLPVIMIGSMIWFTGFSCMWSMDFYRIICAYCFISEALFYRKWSTRSRWTDFISDSSADQRLA